MTRQVLPQRRDNVRLPMQSAGQKFDVTISFFDDGRPAEAFLSSVKVGSTVQALGRDGAILLSLALQYGCPVDVIQKALTRDEWDRPASLIGELVDQVVEECKRRGSAS